MINPAIRRLHMLKKAHAKTYRAKTKKKKRKEENTSVDIHYEHGPCLICGKADASKTNSHIVPSFLVSMYDSYDNSGKRGRDLQISITDIGRSTYVGAIPSTKYDEIFNEDSLNDEKRIEELKNNPDAIDYVFCPTCERLLADLLESPYADAFKQDKGIDGTIAYYFWISVIWRMNSCRKNFGFQLDESTSKTLHKMLLSYLDNNGQLNERNKPNPDIFKYKLLYCPNYCKDTQKGFQYCNYKNNVLTFIISDFIVIVYMGTTNNLPDNYMFDVISDVIKNTDFNTGNEETENKLIINREAMESVKSAFIKYAVNIKIKHYDKVISMLWKQLNIPIQLTESIMKEIILEIFSEETKLVERETVHSIAIAIESVLKKHGIIRQ